MAFVTYDVDAITHVIHSVKTRDIGTVSPYYSTDGELHPGTSNNVEGWKWDQRTWPLEEEYLSTSYVPTIWEPELSNIPSSFYQSGIGDGNDLLLLDVQYHHPSGSPSIWAPVLNHGWYYVFDQDWYLYSDQGQTEYFSATNTISGQQYQDLKYQIKDGVPVMIRQYAFDRTTSKYTVGLDFRKKIEFTVSGTEPEFIVDHSSTPPRIILNDIYTEAVGSGVTIVSGVANPVEVTALEYLGLSTGDPSQEFTSTYNPIEPTAAVQVLSYTNAANPTEWTVISGIDDFTISGQEVYVDRSLGRFVFGDRDLAELTGAGLIPNTGERIVAHYTKALEVTYEPQDIALDRIISLDSNVNPLATAKSSGFIQITTEDADEAASIVLTADLPFTPPSTYDIEMGNNAGELIATVKTRADRPVEGQLVTFQINDPAIGDFGGGVTTVTAITDSTGVAHVFYNAPSTISEGGSFTTDVTVSGSETTVDVLGVGVPTSTSGLFTYQVHEFDTVLGMSETSGINHYTEFFTEERIAGATANQAWEEIHREANGLLEPLTYPTGDITTGAKTILMTTRTIVNPHTGVLGSGLATLHPTQAVDIGTESAPQVRLTYDSILPLPAGINNTKSYLVIGESVTPVQAWVSNSRTNQRIYSNIIQLAIGIPDTMNGNFYADALSDIPSGLMLTAKNVDLVSDAWINTTSGLYWDEYQINKLSGESYLVWFRRTQRGATTVLGLTTITASGAPAEIPLGFRLKSQDITGASILDAVTFIDADDRLSDDFCTPSGWYNILT